MTTETLNGYQEGMLTFVKRRDDVVLTPQLFDLIHGALGAASEVGELCDNLKRHLAYGKELNLPNVKEEVGDILWYASLCASAVDVTLQDVAEANLRKLAERRKIKGAHIDKNLRDLTAEEQALEG
jgi:NTP pyrophosphatase (non-canonical NTP hydrolase)